MAIESFSDLITQVNAMLQNFAAAVGLDVTSANSTGQTDFTKAVGTFVNSPGTPYTSPTIPLNTTGAVRGGICALWYKGAVLSSSSFTGGSVVLVNGQNSLNELCLVFIMYDKENASFSVNIQTGATGVEPPPASATAPTITVSDPSVGSPSATAPTITVSDPASNTLFTDDFTGTTISSQWTVSNANTAVFGLSQNDEFIYEIKEELASGAFFNTDTLKSTAGIQSNNITAIKFDLSVTEVGTGTATQYQSLLIGLLEANYTTGFLIAPRANSKTEIEFRTGNGSVWTTRDYQVADIAGSWKLTRDSSGNVRAYRWNGSAWTLISGPHASVYTSANTDFLYPFVTGGNGNTGAGTSSGITNTWKVDNLHVTDFDFSTLNP